MADIAILVAEEYERRMKINPRQQLNQEEQQQIRDLGSGISISATVKKKMMELGKFNVETSSDLKWAFEPKSQVGLAASAGFFSA